MSLHLCLSHKNTGVASKKLALSCSPIDSPVAALYGGLDVLIHTKEIGWIVRPLDGRQALIVVPIGGFDALITFLHHSVHVRTTLRVGVQILPVPPGPIDDAALLRRVWIDSHDHPGPGGLSVTPGRVMLAYPSGIPSLISSIRPSRRSMSVSSCTVGWV